MFSRESRDRCTEMHGAAENISHRNERPSDVTGYGSPAEIPSKTEGEREIHGSGDFWSGAIT